MHHQRHPGHGVLPQPDGRVHQRRLRVVSAVRLGSPAPPRIQALPSPAIERRRPPSTPRPSHPLQHPHNPIQHHLLLPSTILITMKSAPGHRTNVVLRSLRRRTWGGVGLDHGKRRRHFIHLCGLRQAIVIPNVAPQPCHSERSPSAGSGQAAHSEESKAAA